MSALRDSTVLRGAQLGLNAKGIPARGFDFLPASGVILVFGGVGSGKNCAVLQPLLDRFVEEGDFISLFDRRETGGPGNLRLNGSPSRSTERRVYVINEAQLLFGPVTHASLDDGLFRKAVLEAAGVQSTTLLVLAFQSVAAIDVEIRPALLGAAAVEIYLRNSCGATNAHVAGRDILRWGGLVRSPCPPLTDLITDSRCTRPFAEAIISTRKKLSPTVTARWNSRLERLPMKFAPRETRLNGPAGGSSISRTELRIGNEDHPLL